MPTLQILPPSGRPQLPQVELEALLQPFGIDFSTYPLVVAGVRGYFRKSMGPTAGNDRGVYDDALFLYAPRIGLYRAFNGNTDPASVRGGNGQGSHKGMAVLNPGVWYAYRFDIHNGKYPHEAICQRAGTVGVTRDGTPPYGDVGWFGINIHRGGNYSTSSEGCQTVPPVQWEEFIGTAHDAAKRVFGDQWRQRTVAYALLEQSPQRQAPAGPGPAPVASAIATRFLEEVIRPTLQGLGRWSRAAELLLLGTAIAESGLEDRVQHGGGPALGLFQMEMATHDDIWANYLKYHAPLAHAVRSLQSTPPAAPQEELARNDRYACAMARVHYLRVSEPLPADGDVQAMARYWKRYYNTEQGRGSVDHFLAEWGRFMA